MRDPWCEQTIGLVRVEPNVSHLQRVRAQWAPTQTIATFGRGAEPPSRNGLSNANKIRDAEMAEELFWTVLEHLGRFQSGFSGREYANWFSDSVQVNCRNRVNDNIVT